MKTKMMFVVVLAVSLSGCFTVREPVAPEVEIPSLPAGKTVSVQLSGFEATFVSYTPVYGYTTVSGWYGGRRGRHGFGTTTVATTEYIPRTEATSLFLDRAADALERAGCVLQTASPQYRVEVKFVGPYDDSGDDWTRAGWFIGSSLTADYAAQNWMAKLRVHEIATGKLVLSRDISQRYETVVWGPIPLFSPLSSDATDGSVMKMWCLSALTDQATAEVMTWLVR